MNQIAEEFLYDEDDADTGTNEDETTASASSASHRRGARLEAAVMVGVRTCLAVYIYTYQ